MTIFLRNKYDSLDYHFYLLLDTLVNIFFSDRTMYHSLKLFNIYVMNGFIFLFLYLSKRRKNLRFMHATYLNMKFHTEN